MNPLTQSKKTTILPLLTILTLVSLALSPMARAVFPPPDGCYPDGNTAEGCDALFSLTTGSSNTAIGNDALHENTTGSDNTATGNDALHENTTGSDNTATGNGALFSNINGNFNTANGDRALANNIDGDDNTAIGFFALFSNTGNRNTATGANALLNNTTGDDNTAIGFFALLSNTTGDENTAIGLRALEDNISGNANTAIGRGALRENTEGSANTATGVTALRQNATGSSNTATGAGALNENFEGSSNTATGANALPHNSTGSRNTATGNDAMVNNRFGDHNTATGASALFSNIDGIENTAIGAFALRKTSGSNNIALGFVAGGNLTAGDNNVAISNLGVAAESHTIRIGMQVAATDEFGNLHPAHTATFIAGISETPIGGGGSSVRVNANGQLGTAPSSARFKQNIKPIDNTSEAIHALKPVTFRYKEDLDPEGIPQFGLVAEDVEKVNPDLVTRDAKGEVYTVRYEAVNAMLLNEFLKEHRMVQEQQKEIDALRAELKEQRALIQKVNDKVELDKPAPQTVLNNQ